MEYELRQSYVGHPVQMRISTVVEVVSLRETKEAAFSFSTGSGHVPHDFEGFFVDLCVV